MPYKLPKGERPMIGLWSSATDNGDGTETAYLSEDAVLQIRDWTANIADMLNGGTPLSNIVGEMPISFNRILKQDLYDVKLSWSNVAKPVAKGDVLSHDNGSTMGLWEAQTSTSVEPAKSSDDWVLVYEIEYKYTE